ncbi:hypothetical protein [Aquabacterium sp.]
MNPAQLKAARHALAYGASLAQVARITGCTLMTIALAHTRGLLNKPA